MAQQPNERAATSLRLEGPGLGLGLDPNEVDAYLAAVNAGLIVAENPLRQGHAGRLRAPRRDHRGTRHRLIALPASLMSPAAIRGRGHQPRRLREHRQARLHAFDHAMAPAPRLCPRRAVQPQPVLRGAAGIVPENQVLPAIAVAELTRDLLRCGVPGRYSVHASSAPSQPNASSSTAARASVAVPMALLRPADPRPGANRPDTGEVIRPHVLDAYRLTAQVDGQRQMPALWPPVRQRPPVPLHELALHTRRRLIHPLQVTRGSRARRSPAPPAPARPAHPRGGASAPADPSQSRY